MQPAAGSSLFRERHSQQQLLRPNAKRTKLKKKKTTTCTTKAQRRFSRRRTACKLEEKENDSTSDSTSDEPGRERRRKRAAAGGGAAPKSPNADSKVGQVQTTTGKPRTRASEQVLKERATAHTRRKKERAKRSLARPTKGTSVATRDSKAGKERNAERTDREG